MRSSLMMFTLATALLALSQREARGQYAWAPPATYAYPAAQPVAYGMYYAAQAAEANPMTSSTYIGDLADEEMQDDTCDAKGGKGGKGGSKCSSSCNCLACQRDVLASRTFGSLEYMHWYNRGRHLPPLVSTSPQGTAPGVAGVLGSPSTRILVGDESIGSDRQAAGRVTFGLWLDDCRDIAVGARVFGVEGHESGYFAQSAGNPILALPFYNDDPLIDAEDAVLVAFPGLTQGSIDVDTNSEVFGSEVFLRYMVDGSCRHRFDVVAGYHFTRINDDLVLTSQIDDGAAVFDLLDEFKVSNEFHGGEFGILGEWYACRWTLSALGKVSYGNMHQRVAISGQNTVTAGGPVTTPGGLFTQPTNFGVYERDVQALLPEANFKLGYAVNENLSLSVGYTLMYWNRVALAGDHVDHNVNGTQLNGGTLAGPATPAFVWADTDFWVQTVDIGVSYNY